MSKLLSEIAQITYGADYKKNHPGDRVPIYGTGGIMGYTSIPLNTGPAVLSGRKGSINSPIYVEGKFWNVDTIFCIKANDDTDTKWLFYNFQNTDLLKLNEATGVPSVSASALKRLSFNYFNLPIQRKIARILSTIDGQIEKTEAIIAKYQAVKQGMLQDLFTRGIDCQTGQLRPRYEDAPDLYQDSPLGMIPKEWELAKLGQLTDVIDPQPDHRTPPQVSEGFPYLGISDISEDGKINYRLCRLVSQKAFNKQRRSFKITKGDIIFGKIGTIGQPKRLPTEFDYALSANVMLLKPFQNPEFIFQFLVSPFVDRQVQQTIHVTSQPAFGMDKIRNLSVVAPAVNERNSISEALLTQDRILLKERQQLAKLQLLKQGLMQDLLSGKVKVTA